MSHKVCIDVVVGSGDTISSNYNSEISFRNAENEFIKDPDYYPSTGNIVLVTRKVLTISENALISLSDYVEQTGNQYIIQ